MRGGKEVVEMERESGRAWIEGEGRGDLTGVRVVGEGRRRTVAVGKDGFG